MSWELRNGDELKKPAFMIKYFLISILIINKIIYLINYFILLFLPINYFILFYFILIIIIIHIGISVSTHESCFTDGHPSIFSSHSTNLNQWRFALVGLVSFTEIFRNNWKLCIVSSKCKEILLITDKKITCTAKAFEKKYLKKN